MHIMVRCGLAFAARTKVAEQLLVHTCSWYPERDRSRLLVVTKHCSHHAARPSNEWPASRGATKRIEAFQRRQHNIKCCSFWLAACLWIRHDHCSKQRTGEHCTAVIAYNICRFRGRLPRMSNAAASFQSHYFAIHSALG